MAKPDSLLEISIGSHSKLYATKGKEWKLFVGIDINMNLCRQAKKQGLEVVCCDAFNLPFKPKSFQDVCIRECIFFKKRGKALDVNVLE